MTGVLPTWTGLEPLPTAHTLLLEASAGTGKTWQIAHLVTRLVAESNLPIERILSLRSRTTPQRNCAIACGCG